MERTNRRHDVAVAIAITALSTLFIPCAAVGGRPAVAAGTVITAASVTAAAGTTTVTVDMTTGVEVRVVPLPDPWRVVVELPTAEFRLPVGAGVRPAGLVRAVTPAPGRTGRAELVIATTGPVVVARAQMVNLPTGGVRLAIDLTAPSVAALAPAPTAPAPAAKPPSDVRARPVVVIDPGHCGVDPGAIGAGGTTEKAIVLAVGRELQRVLQASGRYDVRMTRTGDVFVALDRRVTVSEEAKADLFLSLHADAIEDTTAAYATQGASVYTLSDRASDEQARKMAEKENAADLVAGIGPRGAGDGDDVRGILTDLWARETSAFSQTMSRSLIGSLGRIQALARQPQRSAAFRVLRQTRTPAVLIELGFLSNPTEEARMTAPAWQRQIAASIATAVDTYFQKRGAARTTDLPASGGQPP